MWMHRWMFGMLALAGGGLAVWGAAPPLVVVGDEMPPYVYLEGGQPAGIVVEMVEAIFTRLGVAHEFRVYPWQRAWMMVERGAVEAVVNVSYQPEREEFLYFDEEQKETGQQLYPPGCLWGSEYVFFVNRKLVSALQYASLEQIAADGYRVAVDRGYSYDRAFRQASFERIFGNTPEESMQNLAERRADLYACDRTVGLTLLRQLGLETSITFIPKPIFWKPYYIGFSRGSTYPELGGVRERFHRELSRFIEAGEHVRIFERHALRPPGRPLVRPVLFVAEPWKPFEFVEQEQVRGLNVEVVERIMGRLGVPYEIRLYPWSRVLAMVEHGRAEVVLSVSHTADRERFLYYTEEQKAGAIDQLPADYLWASEYFFFVMKKNLGRLAFESYEQLRRAGYRIGTNKNYSYHPEFLQARLGTREFNSLAEGLRALVNDEIDLYPMDRLVGLAELRDMGLLGSVTHLPKPMFSKSYLAPYCRLSDYPDLDRLMAEFRRELRNMRASGEYQEIYQKYCADLRLEEEK